MTKILLATVAILAFAAPSFAQQDKNYRSSAAHQVLPRSMWLKIPRTMKCQVVNTQPAAGGKHEGCRCCSSDTRFQRKQL